MTGQNISDKIYPVKNVSYGNISHENILILKNMLL